MILQEIQAALEAEMAATPAFYDFRVQHREADGALWRVRLEPGTVFAEGQRPGLASSQALLDDSLDGASAWWGADPSAGSGSGSSSGGASVLAVHPESDELVLHQVSSAPPGPGRLIRLYPPRFLPSLLEAWGDPRWAAEALAQATCLNGAPEPCPGPRLTGAPFRWLRAAQRSALGLTDWRCGFLWGPPGTGKTTTLGVLLAEFLDTRPQARVLLLSTTNQAVDLATLAVDKALREGPARGPAPGGAAARHALRRGRLHRPRAPDPDRRHRLVARLARPRRHDPASRATPPR
jgi:DNA replication ATP-dependent helicase Dna2